MPAQESTGRRDRDPAWLQDDEAIPGWRSQALELGCKAVARVKSTTTAQYLEIDDIVAHDLLDDLAPDHVVPRQGNAA